MHSALAGVGLAIFTTGFLLMLYKLIVTGIQKISQHFKRSHNLPNQSELFNKWITDVSSKIRKNNLRIKVTQYIALTTVLVVGSFVLSMYIFKNFAAAVFLSASFFVIPEYLISIIHDRRRLKIENQLVAAIRIFSATFIQTPQIEKGLAAVAVRVGNPVGQYFNEAYYSLMIGRPPDVVMAKLAGKLDMDYGKIFVQLIQQVRKDASVHVLFLELLSKIERHIELTRRNTTRLSGERVLAFIMAMLPIPAYLFISRVIPESRTFITEIPAGRTLITLAFGSIFIWTVLDRIVRRVEA